MNQAEKEITKLMNAYSIGYFLEENNTIDRWWYNPDKEPLVFYGENKGLLWLNKIIFVTLRDKYRFSKSKTHKFIRNFMKKYGIMGDYKITENINDIYKVK